MAPWPAPALAREFPPAFDRAFSDRFGGRDLLVRFHHGALLRVFGVSSLGTVMRGTDGWFYWLGEDGHSLDRHYRGTLEFPQAYVDDTVAELARRQRLARGAGHRVRRRRRAGEVHDLSRAPAAVDREVAAAHALRSPARRDRARTGA